VRSERDRMLSILAHDDNFLEGAAAIAEHLEAIRRHEVQVGEALAEREGCAALN
jgi:hypothetical protein